MRYLPWQCESEGALCNCVPLVKILRWFLRWPPKMPGGNQESSKYNDASYSSSSVWRFPNFCDGCFCFSWLPLIFNNVFLKFTHTHTQKDGWKILWWNAVFMFGWTDPGYKEIPNDPEMIPQRQEVLKGPHLFKEIHGWCWVCFLVYCGLSDKTFIAFKAFNVCLAEAHSSLLVYTWRWESYRSCDGKVVVTICRLNFSKALPSHRVI